MGRLNIFESKKEKLYLITVILGLFCWKHLKSSLTMSLLYWPPQQELSSEDLAGADNVLEGVDLPVFGLPSKKSG